MNENEELHREQDTESDNIDIDIDIDIDDDEGFGDFDIPEDELNGGGDGAEDSGGSGESDDGDLDDLDEDDWLGDDEAEENGDISAEEDAGESDDGGDGTDAGDLDDDDWIQDKDDDIDGDKLVDDNGEEIPSEADGDAGASGDSESSADTGSEELGENARLARELAAYKRQARATAKALGYDGEGDPMDSLVRVAAEAEDKSIEVYLAEKAERDKREAERLAFQQTKFSEKVAKDLSEVHAAFPETKKYDSIKKLPNVERFGELRDLGLSPKEAYIAANPDAVRDSAAAYAKRQALNDTKSHLTPIVSKRTSDYTPRMTKRELAEYRMTFPDKSDKEIIALWRQSIQK